MKGNAALVPYKDGYLEVTDDTAIAADGRREFFLSCRDDTAAHATNKAEAEIARLKLERWQITVGIEPTGTGDVPFSDFDIGDTITVPDQDGTPTALRVVGMMLTEDEAGHPVYRPEVGVHLPSMDERQANINRTQSRGAVAGRTNNTQPVSGPARLAVEPPTVYVPPWSMSGEVVLKESGRFVAPTLMMLRSLTASLATSGSTTTTVALKVDGSSVETISLGSGVNTNTDPISVLIAAGSYIAVEVTAAGTGAEDLTVQYQ